MENLIVLIHSYYGVIVTVTPYDVNVVIAVNPAPDATPFNVTYLLFDGAPGATPQAGTDAKLTNKLFKFADDIAVNDITLTACIGLAQVWDGVKVGAGDKTTVVW